MADISDVEQAVTDAVTAILYPTDSAHPSVIGALCRVYRGWPNSATLNTDLNAGAVNVTIGSDNDSGRITTRYLPEWTTAPAQAGTVISADGQSFSIAGNPTAGASVRPPSADRRLL